LLARRGFGGGGRSLLRGGADPAVVAAGMMLDDRVDAALRREALIGAPGR
jgi:transketolase C-terminal domain/subunit